MRRPDEIVELVEEMLSQGIDSREAIVEAVSKRVRLSKRELVRVRAEHDVSLAIAKMRDDDGNRVAFPGRNADGDRVIVHITYATDARTVFLTGERLERMGNAQIRAGRLLQQRARQLGLFDVVEGAAA